jgi:hypothetical protein
MTKQALMAALQFSHSQLNKRVEANSSSLMSDKLIDWGHFKISSHPKALESDFVVPRAD